MKFSIIVPIYNSELFLHECIDSVQNQTCSDWEMILVDDGSTDQSGNLADAYSRSDERIKVIHKQNAGQLWARRDGIGIAEGEYLLFLDSDDYWRRDCLEILAEKIENEKPDVIMFPARKFGDEPNGGRTIGAVSSSEHWMEKEKIYWTLLSGVDYNSMCLKAWKRSLFDGDMTDYSKFTEACWGEDKAQLLHPITNADRILYIPEELYYYRSNPGGVIQSINLHKIAQMLSNPVFELVYEYVKRWDLDNIQTQEAIAVAYLRNFLSVYYKLRKACKKGKQRKAFRAFDWDQVLCIHAFRYAYSTKLTPKEKLKLFVARYLRIL